MNEKEEKSKDHAEGNRGVMKRAEENKEDMGKVWVWVEVKKEFKRNINYIREVGKQK